MIINESLIPWDASEQQVCKTNLIILYDHMEQDNVFIIKNPSKEDIIKIYQIGFDDHKNPLNYDLEKYFYFVNTNNLVEIDYNDESLNLVEYFYSLKDFFLKCYELLTENYEGEKGYSNGNENALHNFINNEYSPLYWFYKISDEKGKYLNEKLIKIKNSLKDFKTFVQTIKPLYANSVCDCDSGRSYNFIDLEEEKMVLGSSKTTFHFIETLDEYYVQMQPIKDNLEKRREQEHKEWEEKIKNGEIEESIQVPDLKIV